MPKADPKTKLHEILHEKLTKQIKTGRPKHFDNAQQMLDECMEYFLWLDNNPLHIDNIVNDQGSPIRMPKHRERAPTVSGMCLFLGISIRKWEDYAKDSDDSVRMVHSAVGELVRERKFVYGAANEFNSRIIAMDLGLTSKVELGGGDRPIEWRQVEHDMDPRQAAASYAATLESE